MKFLRPSIITALFLLLTAHALHCGAQKPEVTIVNREISLGVGAAPVITSGTLSQPVFSLDFCKLLNDFFVVGGSVGVSDDRLFRAGKNRDDGRFVSGLGLIRANFISYQYFKLYVSLGAGVMYGRFPTTDDSEYRKGVNFAWHGGGGCEFGDLYVFFCEVGMGCRGLASCGFRVRF